ncbi:hypothetical protein [Alteraurantiacibacter aquimixticola]|uniref:Uncharacterized protein n=1 Tax=Alteraurantiacibacter aquimixticola TaxID=2489173 RepID=A0A4T3F2Y3_9SPHN|nr:hypothetical protein [Alteraurantiacibacter aquimixticola]TIX51596.1 hypothetical protein E5222_03850 [Alteraurantiacibacter aquimixticola]
MRKFLGAAASAMLLAACGSSDEGTITTEDGEMSYSADRDSDEVTLRMRGEDGDEATMRMGGADSGDVELPDGFTIYPGATVDSHITIGGDNRQGAIVNMTSPDSPDKIIAFYRQQADRAGVTINSEISANGMELIGGEKEDGTVLSVSAMPDDDGPTIIQLTVGRDG